MAREMPFTPRTLKNLKPSSTRYEVRESGRTGLRVRIEPSGAKSFRWACTARGKVFTFGRFGDGTGGTIALADARRLLETYKAKHDAGVDPEGVDRRERPRTVKDLAEVWYTESILLRRRRPDAVRDVLDRDIIPTIGRLPLVAVDALAARSVATRTVKRGAPVHAVKVLALTRQLFQFAAANGFMATNPAASLRGEDIGAYLAVRKRYLSAEEIRLVLAAIDKGHMGPAIRLGLRLLFFSGLRTREMLTLEWSDVDLEGETVTVRPENQKTTLKRIRGGKVKPYVVPLSAPALEAVKALRELAPAASRFVFYAPRGREGRVHDDSLERALREARTKDKRLAVRPVFSPHSFRNTMATHMTETLRLPPWIGQFCLGHSLNRMLGSAVAETYDHATLLPDRRKALEAYATWIEGLCTGATAKVIPIAEGSR